MVRAIARLTALQQVRPCGESTGTTRYLISLDLFTSFSKDKAMYSLVETAADLAADLLSEYICNFVTDPLVSNGREQARWVLKPLLKFVIKKMLIYVIEEWLQLYATNNRRDV